MTKVKTVKIPQLKENSNPGPTDLLVIRNTTTGKDEFVQLVNIGTGGQSADLSWKPNTDYTTGQIKEFGSKLYKATDDSNNQVPFDGSEYWDEVSRAFGSKYVEDTVYTQTTVFIVREKTWYELDSSVTRPFLSEDFDGELTAGKWNPVTGSLKTILETNPNGGAINMADKRIDLTDGQGLPESQVEIDFMNHIFSVRWGDSGQFRWLSINDNDIFVDSNFVPTSEQSLVNKGYMDTRALASNTHDYSFSTSTSIGSLGIGQAQVNAATYSGSTRLNMHKTTRSGANIGLFLNSLSEGDEVVIAMRESEVGTARRVFIFTVTSEEIVDNANTVEIPIGSVKLIIGASDNNNENSFDAAIGFRTSQGSGAYEKYISSLTSEGLLAKLSHLVVLAREGSTTNAYVDIIGGAVAAPTDLTTVKKEGVIPDDGGEANIDTGIDLSDLDVDDVSILIYTGTGQPDTLPGDSDILVNSATLARTRIGQNNGGIISDIMNRAIGTVSGEKFESNSLYAVTRSQTNDVARLSKDGVTMLETTAGAGYADPDVNLEIYHGDPGAGGVRMYATGVYLTNAEQARIAELTGEYLAQMGGAQGAQTASQLSATSPPGMSGTNVQALIEELKALYDSFEEGGGGELTYLFSDLTEFAEAYSPQALPFFSDGSIAVNDDNAPFIQGGKLRHEMQTLPSGAYSDGRSEIRVYPLALDPSTDTTPFRGKHQVKNRRGYRTTREFVVDNPATFEMGPTNILQWLFQRINDAEMDPDFEVDTLEDLPVDPRADEAAPVDSHYIVGKVNSPAEKFYYFDELSTNTWLPAPETNTPPFFGLDIYGHPTDPTLCILGYHAHTSDQLEIDTENYQEHFIKGLVEFKVGEKQVVTVSIFWDERHTGNGYIEIEFNGKKVEIYIGPTGSQGPHSSYNKFGNYLSSYQTEAFMEFVRMEGVTLISSVTEEFKFQDWNIRDFAPVQEKYQRMAWYPSAVWYTQYPGFAGLDLSEDHSFWAWDRIFNNSALLYKGDGSLHDFLLRLNNDIIEVWYMDDSQANAWKAEFEVPDYVLDYGNINHEKPALIAIATDVSLEAEGIQLWLQGVELTALSTAVIGTGFAYNDNGVWENRDRINDRMPSGYHGSKVALTGLLIQTDVNAIYAAGHYSKMTTIPLSAAVIHESVRNDGNKSHGATFVPDGGRPRFQSHVQVWPSKYRENIRPAMDEEQFLSAAAMPYAGADGSVLNGGIIQKSKYLKSTDPVQAILHLHGTGQAGSGAGAVPNIKLHGPLYGGEWNDYVINGRLVVLGLQFIHSNYGSEGRSEQVDELDEMVRALTYLKDNFNCIGGLPQIMGLSQGSTGIRELILRGDQNTFGNIFMLSGGLPANGSVYNAGPDVGNPVNLGNKKIFAWHGATDSTFPPSYWDLSNPTSRINDLIDTSDDLQVQVYIWPGLGHSAQIWTDPFTLDKRHPDRGFTSVAGPYLLPIAVDPADAVIAEFDSAGATLDSTWEGKIRAAVSALVSAGKWDNLDSIFAPILPDSVARMVDWKGNRTPSLVGTWTWDEDNGIVAGSGAAINLGIKPADLFAGDLGEVGAKFGLQPDSSGSDRIIGARDATNRFEVYADYGNSRVFSYYKTDDQSFPTASDTTPQADTYWTFRLSPALRAKILQNGVAVDSGADYVPTQGHADLNIYLNAYNFSGGAGSNLTGASYKVVHTGPPDIDGATYQGIIDTFLA